MLRHSAFIQADLLNMPYKYNIHNPSNATKRRFEFSRTFIIPLYFLHLIILYQGSSFECLPLSGFCKEPKYLHPKPVSRQLLSVTDIGPPQDRIYIYPKDSLELYRFYLQYLMTYYRWPERITIPIYIQLLGTYEQFLTQNGKIFES